MHPRLALGLGATLALLLALGGVANADDPGGSGAGGPDIEKLDSSLQMLAGAAARGDEVDAETGLGSGAGTLVSGVRIDADERVLVDVYLDGSGAGAKAALEGVGMEVVATASAPQRIVEGWLAADALVDATAVDGVRALRGVPAQTRDEGTVLSEGDAAHNGPAARALGTTGAGIKVGVVSDSINLVGGGVASSQASGNLPGPASTPAGSVTILQEDAGGPIDEGRAMAEIIFDTAPGVRQMYFATGTLGAASKASNIAALVAQGVQVIADDIFYIDQPFFQDGVVTQAVDAAKAAGVTYLASAGNRGRQSWEGTLTGATNDFDPGAGVDDVQTIGTFTNRFPFISLQWAEPWGGATTDLALDIYLNGVFAGTLDSDNISSGIPAEFASINLSGITRTVGVKIRRVAGTGTPFMKYIVGGTPAFTIAEYPTNSHAINPDAASAKGALTIAASNWATPQFPEAFSSRGPAVTRRFDTAGAPLGSFDVRPKPDLAAADGVSTSVSTFPTFFGTSAATPSAAGIAILVKAAKPSLTVDQVAAIMKNPAGALDCTPTAGQPDLDCGAGFVLANKAVAAAQDTSPPVIAAVTSPSSPNGKDGWFTSNVTLGWSVTDSASPILSSSGCGAVAVTSEGSQTLTCQATSIGGSGSGATTVKVDKTKPVKLKFKGIKKIYANGALPVKSKVKCKAKDPTSGIKSCKIKGLKLTKGTHKLKATAINKAGLKTKATFKYTIL